MNEIAQELARIAEALSDRYLSADGVAALIDYKPAQVRERLACKPGFPKPARIDGGHPRWQKSEVMEWMEKQKDKTGGRKRANQGDGNA